MIVSRSSMPRAAAAWAPSSAIVAPRTASDPLIGHAARSSALRLSVEWPAPGVVVVSMSGEVDLATVPRLTELIRQRLTAAALHAVVLDLSEVSFASSAALELLLHCERRCEHRGIGLYVVPGEGAVRRLLRVAGLCRHFSCRGSAAEAVADAGR
ncbi:STAS domain-containing protein [Saccharopolyspora rosea]|uniref:Anti-sigma factor antagonist n=1 Tax=Saccharopolyspora rosea TaxID=524884 RepID=A0ABW3FSP0_9PSEU|nr:STAS domain-containing protein [Saccharopolyspora rosea]